MDINMNPDGTRFRYSGVISRVHTWKSEPVPIRITLIRMSYQGMDSYFKLSDVLWIQIKRICIEMWIRIGNGLDTQVWTRLLFQMVK